MSELTCKSREAAITVIASVAGALPGGVQKESLLAVKDWIQTNTESEIDLEERDRKLREIFFSETEGERLGREWYDERGSRKLASGEWVNSEPADGAEWKCRWNAKTKRWEPPFPPPLTTHPGEV